MKNFEKNIDKNYTITIDGQIYYPDVVCDENGDHGCGTDGWEFYVYDDDGKMYIASAPKYDFDTSNETELDCIYDFKNAVIVDELDYFDTDED